MCVRDGHGKLAATAATPLPHDSFDRLLIEKGASMRRVDNRSVMTIPVVPRVLRIVAGALLFGCLQELGQVAFRLVANAAIVGWIGREFPSIVWPTNSQEVVTIAARRQFVPTGEDLEQRGPWMPQEQARYSLGLAGDPNP